MRVSKTDMICGVSAVVARQLMRDYWDDRPVEVACEVLAVDRNAARKQLSAFQDAGYLQRSENHSTPDDDWWVTTTKGNALAQASFGKPITRATATRHLTLVIERARSYNNDPARLLTIAKIVVFGSYLDPAVGRLGDLDLAISAVRRETNGDRHVNKVIAYARASGRRFDAFHEQLFWPARELLMILRNRSPAISITTEDISKLTDRFEVVYDVGNDPDAIPPPPDAMAQS